MIVFCCFSFLVIFSVFLLLYFIRYEPPDDLNNRLIQREVTLQQKEEKIKVFEDRYRFQRLEVQKQRERLAAKRRERVERRRQQYRVNTPTTPSESQTFGYSLTMIDTELRKLLGSQNEPPRTREEHPAHEVLKPFDELEDFTALNEEAAPVSIAEPTSSKEPSPEGENFDYLEDFVPLDENTALESPADPHRLEDALEREILEEKYSDVCEEEKDPESTTTCPNCGKPVQTEWSTCQYCMTGLEHPPTRSSNSKQ